MDKNHVIGAVIGILIGILGSVGLIDSSAVKGAICGSGTDSAQVAK